LALVLTVFAYFLPFRHRLQAVGGPEAKMDRKGGYGRRAGRRGAGGRGVGGVAWHPPFSSWHSFCFPGTESTNLGRDTNYGRDIGDDGAEATHEHTPTVAHPPPPHSKHTMVR
jgi:hypothetical protein